MTSIVAAFVAAAVLPARAQDALGETTGIKGAGSTLVYPLLSMWSRDYRAWLAKGGEYPAPNTGLEDPPATSALEYEAVGSLAGTLRVKEGAVDFGASDMPLASKELAAFGLGQFPIAMGGVTLALNVEGQRKAEIQLTGPLLAAIYLGQVTRWSDPAVREHNPTSKLPDAAIIVIHRSDGSGTTFNFTDYLSKVSPEWKLRAGSGLLITWPTGIAAKGNEGVARAVQSTANSIGYVDHALATQLKLPTALIRNRAGKFVKPGVATFQAAAAAEDFEPSRHFQALLTDTSGQDAYPITATVFALMPTPGRVERTGATLQFFRWCLEHGQTTATSLGYVPLTASLVTRVTTYWQTTFNGAR